MQTAFTFKVYDFSVPAGGVYRLPVTGAYFRIMSSTGAVNVTVEGVGTLPALQSGQALKGIPFGALILQDASGAPNVGQILVASSEFQDNRLNGTVDLSAASLAALESVDLNAATIDAVRRPLASTGFFSDASAITALTPVTVFTPAANVNGAIVLNAGINKYHNVGAGVDAFLAKNGAPASIVDGEEILSCGVATSSAAAVNIGVARLSIPQFVPAGLGLYFISENSYAAGLSNKRYARYRLL